jgi:dephospho-CoA kinase
MTQHKKRIPVIGLLGGIGSGKSTVARIFGTLGCAVIDADVIAHELLETPEVKGLLTKDLGTAILGSDGKVDRKAMAEMVFNNPGKLARLNEIVHPRALERAEQTIRQVRSAGQAPAIIVDAPLLLEAGWDEKCDVLVFVDCHDQKRLERAWTRSGLTREQWQAREKSQISLDTKARLAYYTVDNNADPSALEGQVGSVFSKITG